MSNAQSSSASKSSANRKNQPTFEFTKRKRFADLLITELVGTILLVLSPDCKILFCGAAVTELLGWRDEDLVDGDLIELINEEDRFAFRNCFEESLRARDELLCYVRLKCKSQFSGTINFNQSPKEVLLEFKGHPHFIADEEECRCFFAAATPYPSRNTAMLNTFLDLKMENERLQQRLADLRSRAQAASSMASTSSIPVTYGNSTAQPSYVPSQAGGLMQPYYGASDSINIGGFNNVALDVVGNTFDGTGISSHGSTYAWNPVTEENLSEDGVRKKLKKTHTAEQYVCVTCGRTDSPEWRKGPQGPKTLCNACGLRWAKFQRQADDKNEMAGGSDLSTQAQGSSSSNNTS